MKWAWFNVEWYCIQFSVADLELGFVFVSIGEKTSCLNVADLSLILSFISRSVESFNHFLIGLYN